MHARLFILSSLGLLFFVSCSPNSDTPSQAVRQQAQVMALAMTKQDHETILQNTHPSLVEKWGGRDKMLSVLQKTDENLRRNRHRIANITIGNPGALRSSGDKLYSIVPMEVTVSAQKFRGIQPSYFLAVSWDQGRHWSFIDGSSLSPGQLKALIPDAPRDLNLPTIGPPRFEFDPVVPKKL